MKLVIGVVGLSARRVRKTMNTSISWNGRSSF
jgi:hypothetical protein